MSQSVPKEMKALVMEAKGKAVVKSVPVPTLETNDVLVKTSFATQNPTDWKHVDWVGVPGSIVGCDFSGVIVKLGEGLKNTELKVGDKVAGFVHGGKFETKGSYAEYLRAESDLIFKIPGSGSVTLKDAPQYGIGFTTAVQILYERQNVPYPPQKISSDEWYLVYGGSTSVGLFMIQLAKLAGFKVIATASPKNFDLVKSYGADEVVDYHNAEEASASIKSTTSSSLIRGLDAISEGNSTKMCLDAFATEGKRQLNLLLPGGEEAKKVAAEKGIELGISLAYSLLGYAFEFAPGWAEDVNPSDRAFYVRLNKDMDKFINEYKIRPNPVKEMGGGLEKVNEGFALMREGKVSAEKLTYEISA